MKKFLAAAVLFCCTAYAQDRNPLLITTGNDFLEAHRSFETSMSGGRTDDLAIVYVSFMQGVMHTNHALRHLTQSESKPAFLACIPTGVTSGQAGAVIAKSLRDRPQTTHFAIGLLAQDALSKAFPCK